MNPKIPRPIRLPVPGLRRTVGIGQALKKMTTSLGVPPCASCGGRARWLDRRVVFAPILRKKG
jgi:hypothetical protein